MLVSVRARRSVLREMLGEALKALMLVAVLGPMTALAAAKGDPPKLSAQQILTKNTAARGGLEAWQKVDSMLWVGHIDSVHAAVPSLQFILAQQRPNKKRLEVSAMGDRTLRVFDGTHGWKLRPAQGAPDVRPYSDEELRFEQSGPGMDGVLMGYAGKASSVEVKGIDEIEKRKAYHLIVRTDSGESQHVWVDARTFLEIRYDRPVAAAGSESRTVSIVYRDYKDTGGLKIPSIIETGVGAGNTPDRMIIDKVVLNPPLDAQTFSEPGARRESKRAQTRVPFPTHRPPGSRAGYPPPWANPLPSNPPASPPTPSQDPGATPH